MPEDALNFKVTVKTRVLKYGDGKVPGIDEPDEIHEGKEITWIGQPAMHIMDQLKAGYDVYVDRDRRVYFIERPPGSGPGSVQVAPEIERIKERRSS